MTSGARYREKRVEKPGGRKREHPPLAPAGDEVVTVVDSRNRNPRPVLRSEVFAKRLTHRGVVVLVFNSKGMLFVQQRSTKMKVYGGCWDASCAGTVEWGESWRTCARRELEEELGIAKRERDLRRVGRPYHVTTDKTDEFDQLFETRFDGEVTLQEEEVAGGMWIAPPKVDRLTKGGTVTPWFGAAWLLRKK